MWLAFGYLLPLLLGAAAAAALERPVELLSRRLPRSLASGVCVLGVTLALIVLIWFVSGKAASAVSTMLKQLSETFGSISQVIDRLGDMLGIPADHPWVQQALDSVTASIDALPARISGKLLELVPLIAEKAPDVLLFAVTAVMGTYFISASYPLLRRFVFAQMSRERAGHFRSAMRELKHSVGRWIRAQVIMEMIVFALLAPSFMLLGVSYPLLTALATALVDALPVLGAGTVLLPWAGFQLLSGNFNLGIGLIITYIAVTVLRSGIEAKLLGDQLGMHPLLSLGAVYLGWRVMGIGGMIVFPILAVSIKKLNDCGIVRLWKDTI